MRQTTLFEFGLRIDGQMTLLDFGLEFEDNTNRTHILGGVVDHGTHTTGVCSDECWCKTN